MCFRANWRLFITHLVMLALFCFQTAHSGESCVGTYFTIPTFFGELCCFMQFVYFLHWRSYLSARLDVYLCYLELLLLSLYLCSSIQSFLSPCLNLADMFSKLYLYNRSFLTMWTPFLRPDWVGGSSVLALVFRNLFWSNYKGLYTGHKHAWEHSTLIAQIRTALYLAGQSSLFFIGWWRNICLCVGAEGVGPERAYKN